MRRTRDTCNARGCVKKGCYFIVLVGCFVDSLTGSQHEYKIVLFAGLLSIVLSFITGVRGSKWWYMGMALSSATLAFFTYTLSA
jgi:hypothetical protein